MASARNGGPKLKRRACTASFPPSWSRPRKSASAIFFSAAIIVRGFVPLFTMSGVEGHIFGPMARTYAYAIAGG